MAYDLRSESWIPWQRQSGAIEYGPPWLLTDRITDDPIVAIAAPRPDFGGALQEFLIGLLGVALQIDERKWEELWSEPPTPEVLRAAFAALPPAFDLDGDGPRFFQDFPAADLAAEKAGTVDRLLIDAVGEQTIKLNKDLFVKRGRAERLGRPAAAMALITMQSYAPAGGAGIMTSLRGGGPLTTIVDPRVDAGGRPLAHELPLWQKLWANVETVQQAARRSPAAKFNAPADVFPWLAPTRSSASAALMPASTNPWQAYFGLPRRIRLDFDGAGRCDITGRDDEATVTTYRSRPRGVQYGTWEHPLTPHYLSPGKEWLPVHGQPGGIGWRDWLGLTLGTPDEKRRPAAMVSGFIARGGRVGHSEVRLHAFGFDMDKAKARGWTDASQPVFVIPENDSGHRAILADVAGRLTEGASIVASMLLGSVQRALFQSPDDAPGDMSVVKAELWMATEEDFFTSMRAVASAGTTAATADAVCQRFVLTLGRNAMAIFDRWCPGDASTPAAMRRVVTARFNLDRALGGWTPLGEKLFTALGTPLPGGGRAVRIARSRTRKEASK